MKTILSALLISLLFSCTDTLEESVDLLNAEFANRNHVEVIQQFRKLDSEALLQLPLEVKKKVAYSAFYTANVEDAIALYQEFVALDEQDGKSYFYLALLHSNEKPKCAQYLQLASKAGFTPERNDMNHLFDRDLMDLWQ